MPQSKASARAARSEYAAIAKQWAEAKAAKEAQDAVTSTQQEQANPGTIQGSTKEQQREFTVKQALLMAWFGIIIVFHVIGLYLFTNGFLLTRLVLDHKSECAVPPIDLDTKIQVGNPELGCWHPRTFEKAVVIIIDALRYDFTVPFQSPDLDSKPQHYHNALRVLYETANLRPENAVLLPFIADPPTTTLQRLKGLTTGTLPTFIDAGSNFAGEAIDEDNLIAQLRKANRKVVHLGDDTWHALFPGYFEPNLTKAYDSFNVWDLHTVDNGVIDHLLPLLKPESTPHWDFLIGHLLGVDHAGHRYGPNHPAMTAKLQQMETFITNVIKNIDDKTLLVVLGDHGMDSKGDHGGESDEEVEAALWMYSKQPVFGHHKGQHLGPPLTAKDRPVAQIDLLPTLSLLLGLPIPFNNLGFPIFEAFAGRGGPNFENLARVARITAAQIARYMGEYARIRKVDELANPQQWKSSKMLFDDRRNVNRQSEIWEPIYTAFKMYQQHTLGICRQLWAQFNVPSMIQGIVILGFSLLLVLIYARGIDGNLLDLSQSLVLKSGLGLMAGGSIGVLSSYLAPQVSWIPIVLNSVASGGILGFIFAIIPYRSRISIPYPSSALSLFSAIFIVGLSASFASNSYTIWEDSILIFFLATISGLLLVASLRQEKLIDRTLGSYHAILFGLLTRVASYSRLCREEQMPYCLSTYYSASGSSSNTLWHLSVPVVVAFVLPGVIKQYYYATGSYQYSAIYWFGFAFRGALWLSALFWIFNAADDNSWFSSMTEESLKTTKTMIAQTALGVSIPVGYSIFAWSNPFLAITSQKLDEPETDPSGPPQAGILSPDKKSRLIVHGLSNVHGSRYFPVLTIWAAAIILLQKPLGGGAIAILVWQVLCLMEVLACTKLQSSALGPVTLALLASFHYFTTGHQAVFSSLQWDTAFIPLRTVRQPWSAIFIILNTLGAHMICALAAVLLPLWRAPPRQRGLLSLMARSAATHLAVYTAITLATSMWAMWLRRHLMLFRVFCPRWALAVVVLIGADIATVFLGLGGARWWALSVGEILELPE